MVSIILYSAAIIWLIISFYKDRGRAERALKKAWRSFENILPSMLSILLIVGLILSVVDEAVISEMIGESSGVKGMAIAAAIGCITLIPGYVALPLAASLIQAGAGYTQAAVFISTLMMVGLATIPLESRYFGRTIALKRNFLSLIVAVITSVILGRLMR